MNKKILKLLPFLAVAGILTACGGKDESELKYLKDFDAGDYVTLGDYKGLEIQIPEPQVTEEYLESYINYGLSMDASITPEPVTGRSVETWDIANIDYEGKMDGVPFEGGTAQGTDLVIGSGQFIDGFEDGVMGMEIGETKDIDLSFPDPYKPNPDLSGKPVVFTVTVNSISRKPLTDEYVAGLGLPDCQTAEDYRNYMSSILMEGLNSSFEEAKVDAVVEAAAGNAEFKTPPEGMLNRLKENLTNNAAAGAQMNGVDIGTYVAYMYGGKADAYEETLANQALMAAQRYIMMSAIAGEAGIEITEKEFEETLAKEAAERNYEDVDAYKEAIDIEAYREFLLVQEVMDFLSENAVNLPISE